MNVLITQQKGKEKVVKAFESAGAKVVKDFSNGVDLIIPIVDEELPFFSKSRDWFKSNGIEVAVSNIFAVDTCRDKAEFYRFCKRHEFDVPITAQFEAIIKPRFGKGSKGVYKVDRSYISQEIIDWPEYSVDYFKLGDTLTIIPRARLDVVNGESHAAQIDFNEYIIWEAERLGRELGLEYHNVMQCFCDGKNIKWIEVNCRYGGGSWLTFEKFNSPKYLVELLKEKV